MTADDLKRILPYAGVLADVYLPHLNGAMQEFGILTQNQQAAFIAQIGHESAQLSAVSEGLRYTVAALMRVWPTRFPTVESAQPYSLNPEALANKVYANRMGNGDEASGDGFRYRGAGLIQLTGKDQHFSCALHFNIDPETVGDWLRSPRGAARSAAWYWSENGLNALANKGDIPGITRRINGGLHGLADRMALYQKAQEVLA
jgi:putative chitinase